MVKKKKIASGYIRLAVLSTAFSLIAVANSYAFEGASDNTQRQIQATPFDHQLSQAGFFKTETRNNTQNLPRESADDLFFKARSFRYTHDTREEQWRSPEEIEMTRSGDCKDKALWLYTELKKNGYMNVSLVVGKYRSFDRTFHAWVSYTDNAGVTYLLDPTMQKRVWEATSITGVFYKPIYSFDGQHRYRYVAS